MSKTLENAGNCLENRPFLAFCVIFASVRNPKPWKTNHLRFGLRFACFWEAWTAQN